MPIKFRCQHCRQFLGISRAKAEQVVDCPTCGRSIRVPSLDGRIAPLPKPRLDLRDDALIDALDRLAEIESNENGLVLAGETEGDEQLDESLEPVVMPEVRTAPAPQPIELPPLPADAARPVPIARPAMMAPSDPLAAVSALATDESTETGRRRRGGTSWVLLLLASLACFTGGFVTGRTLAPETAVVPPSEPAPNAPDDPAPAAPVGENPVSITGTVNFKSPTGDRPDVGACVIALPAERGGTIRLSVVGFRPGDTPEDWRVAHASLRALGGDAAIVDSEGGYSLRLPEAGEYRLLVLSHYQPRDTDEPIDSETEQTLTRFFDRPRQLLGESRYVVEPLRWTGGDTAKWSHTFPTADG